MNIVFLAPFYLKQISDADGRYVESRICTVHGHVAGIGLSGHAFIPEPVIAPVWDAVFEGWVMDARRIPGLVETALNHFAYTQSVNMGVVNPRLTDWHQEQEAARAVRDKERLLACEDLQGWARVPRILAEALSERDLEFLKRNSLLDSVLLRALEKHR